ncbi:hypothetical protein PRJ_Dakar_00308 [Faustovirus]|nr:hypothetical protein PRJ_Dakar_00308 [Faustovirus]
MKTTSNTTYSSALNIIDFTKSTNNVANYHREIVNIYNGLNFYKEVNYVPIPKLAHDALKGISQDIKKWLESPHNHQIFVLGCDDAGPGAAIIVNYLRRLSEALPKLVRFDENARAITRIPISVYDWRNSQFTSRFDHSQMKAARNIKKPKLRIYILDNYIPKITTTPTTTSKFYDIRLKLDRNAIEKIFLDAIADIKAKHASATWRGQGCVVKYTIAALIARLREYRVYGMRILYNYPVCLLKRLIYRHYQPTQHTVARHQRVRLITFTIVGKATVAPTTTIYSRIPGAPSVVESDCVNDTLSVRVKRDVFRDIDEEDDTNIADLWVAQTDAHDHTTTHNPQPASTAHWERTVYNEEAYTPYQDPYEVFK